MDAEIARGLGELAVSTGAMGNISPQLPSPGSSGSSVAAKTNVIDQNPPVSVSRYLPTKLDADEWLDQYALRREFANLAGTSRLSD